MFRETERQQAMATPVFWKWLVAGVLATLTMDLGSTLFRKVGFIAGVAPDLVGRWFGSLARGQFFHQTIAQTPPIKGELAMAVAGHYAIGITLTALFWVVLFKGPVRLSGFVSIAVAALAFGLLTNLLPWLLMFPSMGFGYFGVDGPADAMLFRSSLLNHALFGAGLALVTRSFGGITP